MSNKITDKPTSTTQPSSFVAIIGGAVKLLTWAGAKALWDALYAPITRTINGHALNADVVISSADVGLGSVTNDAQLKAADLDTDGTMAANSDGKVPSQKAVRTYANSAAAAAAAALVDSAPGALDTLNELAAALGDDANFGATVTTSLAAKAPLASPALTGTPTAPTATAGTNTIQVATTAFVTTADNLKAPLASPALTGTPTAPTATAGTNTTQVATTAFVATAVSPKASNTTTISVSGGLLSGGGTLAANRTITLAAASQAQAEAGTDTATVMTPLRTAQAIAALASGGGGGGGASALSFEAWLQLEGSDGTGAVGNPARPYATIQAAYIAGARTFHIGNGAAPGYLTVDSGSTINLIGVGRDNCVLTGIIPATGFTGGLTVRGNGASNITIGAIAISSGDQSSGYPADPLGAMFFSSLHVSGDIACLAGSGGAGTPGVDSYDNATPPVPGGGGGAGGAGPTLYVEDCIIDGSVSGRAGSGGVGGAGGSSTDYSYNGTDGANGGDAGAPGAIYVKRSYVAGSLSYAAANPGTAGSYGNGASNGSPGNDGTAGSAGNLYATFCEIGGPAGGGEYQEYRASLVATNWYP